MGEQRRDLVFARIDSANYARAKHGRTLISSYDCWLSRCAGRSFGVTVAGKVAEVRIDAEGPFFQLTSQTVQQIEQLAPFGAGNPRPVLCATGVRLSEPPKKMGTGERHLSLFWSAWFLSAQTRAVR